MSLSFNQKIDPKKPIKTLRSSYRPRALQKKVHLDLRRFNVLVCHRRFGKTVLVVNETIDRAMTNPLRNPQYAYVAPTYKQAKKIAWQYFLDYTRHIPKTKANKGDLEITIERPWRVDPETGEKDPDHIKLMLIGADDPDSLRGLYLDGADLDEFAQCDPIIWGQIIRPALADRGGIAKDMGVTKDFLGRPLIPWAIFIGTPKGQNHFHRRYESALGSMEFAKAFEARFDVEFQKKRWSTFEEKLGIDDNTPQVIRESALEAQSPITVKQYKRYRKYLAAKQWFCDIYKASETGILGQSEIEEMTEDLTQSEIDQELECDFTAAILGSYYGEFINKAKDEDRIGEVPYNPKYPVSTFWDIGINDKCTIWYRQKIGDFYHYIDYDEFEGKGIPEIAKFIKEKPYNFSRHVWPHDGAAKEFGTGVTRQETARLNGLSVYIQPRQAVDDRINATRIRIRLSKFDAKKCHRGLECLYNYQKEYDSKLMMFKNKPKHDWASHGADSYGYSALDDFDDTLLNNYKGPESAVTDYEEF